MRNLLSTSTHALALCFLTAATLIAIPGCAVGGGTDVASHDDDLSSVSAGANDDDAVSTVDPAEVAAYRTFFEESRAVRISDGALHDGKVALYFVVPGTTRDVVLALDLTPLGGAGDVTLDLAGTTLIGAASGTDRARSIDIDELAAMLATPIAQQYPFCTAGNGTGGTIARALVPVTHSRGGTQTAVVEIRNDVVVGDASDGSDGDVGEVLPDACTSNEAVTLTGDKTVWCISWPSSQCWWHDRAERRRCSGEACSLTLASLIDLASAGGVALPAGYLTMPISTLADYISRKLGAEIGGRCQQVWLLDIFWIGCQCVIVTF